MYISYDLLNQAQRRAAADRSLDKIRGNSAPGTGIFPHNAQKLIFIIPIILVGKNTPHVYINNHQSSFIGLIKIDRKY